MRVQTFHNIKDRTTVVVEVPDITTILNVLNSTTREIFIRYGISFCHPKDNFNKKVGRELATERLLGENGLIYHTFELKSVSFSSDRTEYFFTNYSYDIVISVLEDNVRISSFANSFIFPQLKDEE